MILIQITLFLEFLTYEEDNFLQQPNRHIFQLFKKIEKYFEKNCNKSNVFELILEDLSKDIIKFPCSIHAPDILSYLIEYYLENRMRNFIKSKICDKKKTNLNKKKIAKLAES